MARQLWIVGMLCLALASPALSQQRAGTGQQSAEAILAAAKARTSAASVQDRCRRARQADEIVVCVDRGEDLRVPSTAESDPNSLAARRALNNGIPRAPQLDKGSCKGQPGCVIGGWAPPPLYLIDLKAIPQAPEGSDADKVAKGEIPDR